MKHVIYKNRTSQAHHRKVVSIHEFNQDQHAKTHVQKGFLYRVTPLSSEEDLSDAVPEIYIQKRIDTQHQTEEFCFRVRGSFVTMSGRSMVRVNFSHKLRVHMTWKDKVFSPKKSVTLT